MLTPLAPRAGPIGGAGLALPAGKASLMYPVTAMNEEGKGVSDDVCKEKEWKSGGER